MFNQNLCRFINPDPAGFSGGLNFYAYADGNPASLLDPFGLGAVGEGTGSSWLNTAWNVTKGVGMTLGGFVPWLGDVIEGYTIVAPESSTLDRTLSGVSLTLNAWTAGALPNFVPIKRGLNMIGDAFTGAAKTGTTLADDLAAAATRARNTVGSGSGGAYGTRVHTAFEAEVQGLNRGLSTQISYLNGREVLRGTPGSVRLDVVNGPRDAPISIFDLKTGGAQLTPARIQQIQSHVPGGANVPVLEVRP